MMFASEDWAEGRRMRWHRLGREEVRRRVYGDGCGAAEVEHRHAVLACLTSVRVVSGEQRKVAVTSRMHECGWWW